jgi:hypothetical protein
VPKKDKKKRKKKKKKEKKEKKRTTKGVDRKGRRPTAVCDVK